MLELLHLLAEAVHLGGLGCVVGLYIRRGRRAVAEGCQRGDG
jgi:putative copper export protein